MRNLLSTFTSAAVLTAMCGAAGAQAPDRITTDPNGRVLVQPLPVDSRFQNPWTPELEEGFRDRADRAIRFFAEKPPSGGTKADNEQNLYPAAMFQFLAGNRSFALRTLQADDVEKAVHAHTAGVDLYYCPTVMAQVRKYFYFGDYLDPAYRQKMFDAAKAWTEQDPLRRAHPLYGEPKPEMGYGPEVTGSWVDVRGSESLRAMRETSVYLFAEETGNDPVRRIYKDLISRWVRQVYTVGALEWDAENFLQDTLHAYHNLYDFAKDPEVKALGKAALDALYASAALKYAHGGFTGPNSRDFGGGTVVFGSQASHTLALYFGDSPTTDPRPDRDDVYVITSGYRPPRAVVALARKQLPLPAEVWAAKPPYDLLKREGEPAPGFWETQYLGHSFQLGSLVSAGPEKEGNVSPFKLAAANATRGTDYFALNTMPLGEHQEKAAGDQIAQLKNLLVWLRPAEPARTFSFMVPKTAIAEVEGGVWFFRYEKTWLAIRPISLEPYEVAPASAARGPRFKDDRFYQASTAGSALSGLALEVGEQETHGDYPSFKKAVLGKSRLDVSKLAEGTVRFRGATGDLLEVTFNKTSDLPTVVRNGKARDWDRERDLFRSPEGAGPLSLRWRTGELKVRAGGFTFQSKVTETGDASFTETAGSP